MKLDNPCFDKKTKTDCPDRSVGCSITCTKWAEYTKRRAELRKKHFAEIAANSFINQTMYDRWLDNVTDRVQNRRRRQHKS